MEPMGARDGGHYWRTGGVAQFPPEDTSDVLVRIFDRDRNERRGAAAGHTGCTDLARPIVHSRRDRQSRTMERLGWARRHVPRDHGNGANAGEDLWNNLRSNKPCSLSCPCQEPSRWPWATSVPA